MNNEVCHEHSGVCKEVENIKVNTEHQWERLCAVNKRVDSVINRLNILLAAVVVELVVIVVTKIV